MKVGDIVYPNKKLVKSASEFPRYTPYMEKYDKQPGKVIFICDSFIGLKFSNGETWSYKEEWVEYPKKVYRKQLDVVWGMKKETIKFIISEPAVICFLPDGKKGIAKCNSDDEFNEKYGMILAYQRARYNQLFGDKNGKIK